MSLRKFYEAIWTKVFFSVPENGWGMPILIACWDSII
jgi:hypothetical protein